MEFGIKTPQVGIVGQGARMVVGRPIPECYGDFIDGKLTCRGCSLSLQCFFATLQTVRPNVMVAPEPVNQFEMFTMEGTEAYALVRDTEEFMEGEFVYILKQIDNVVLVIGETEDDEDEDVTEMIRMEDLTKVWIVKDIPQLRNVPEMASLEILTDKRKVISVTGDMRGIDVFGMSSCRPEDDFIFLKGLDIALSRVSIDYAEQHIDKLVSQ